jgi:hypothetical protein
VNVSVPDHDPLVRQRSYVKRLAQSFGGRPSALSPTRSLMRELVRHVSAGMTTGFGVNQRSAP